MAGRRREYSEGRTARWGGEEGLDLLRHDEWSAGSSALFLTALAAVSQGLSFCYRVALSRLVGAEVMGLYQLLMPVCSVLLSLTAVGLTAAMSNLSSQYLALGNGKGVAQTRRMCLTALGVGLLPVSAAVVAFYDPISVYLLGDARTQLGLILLLPCVALTGVENIHKHFFYGTGVVRPPAVVELMEQFIRAAAVLGLFLPGPAALLDEDTLLLAASYGKDYGTEEYCQFYTAGLSTGKLTQSGDRLTMPVSLDVHHGFIDGRQAGEFFALLENQE